MAIIEYKIELDNETYRIDLEHGYWSGKRIIHINGRLVLEEKRLIDSGDLYSMNIKGHECISTDFLFELLFKGSALGVMGMLEGIFVWRDREKKYHKPFKQIWLEGK